MRAATDLGSNALAPEGETLFRRARKWLPKGGALPREDWESRHRAIRALLVAQAVGLIVFGVVRGFGLLHVSTEASIPAICALVTGSMMKRGQRAVVATFGLVATSGILVHLSGGTIEAHFHFFIMLAVISLYQDWRAFLLAIAFVAVHHGVAGVVDARSVFNHQAALAHPWTWAAIHALFVLGESVALVIAWRFSERAHEHAAESQHQFMEEQEQRIEERERAAEALSRS
ncbi:MAG TPA: methyl-accepting chemotaxis protein, partial [Actinomycetota bacterium]|nr:methyl-accepting chemotaxis protein [Actinomycetota bacterium]